MTTDFDEITLLIADRATLFRRGLVGLLKDRRPGWACSEADVEGEVLAHLRVEPVDLVLLDQQFVDMPVATNLRRLRALFPNQKVVVLADTDDRATILECLVAGANGYLLKSITMNQLMLAIETVLSDVVVAPAALSGEANVAVFAPELQLRPLLARLTDRQIEVFRLLSEGCVTKTIARRLGVSVGTVKHHLAAIYRVLGAHNRVEAIARACGKPVQPAPLPATGQNDLFIGVFVPHE
jgi:two-component system, NarL family, nitrate/nitrite response regulator NarL